MTLAKYSIFDKMIEGIQIVNNDWQYVYVNDTIALQGKYKKEELLGRSMIEKYPGIENTEMFGLIKKCLSEQSPQQMINEFTFPDDTKGYFELRMQPVPEGVLILSLDVTQQKRAEKALIDTNSILKEKINESTLELTAKTKEIEQFTYIASHDLQEPVRTVFNYIEVLKEDYAERLDENALKYLNAMNRAAERMSNLVKALLDYSKLGRNLKLSPAKCLNLIEKAMEDLEPMIRSSGTVINIEQMPELNVYENEMRHVFQNLLSNAIKFCRNGVNPVIHISAEDVGTKWKFVVKDNGIGIAPEFYERIFYVFQRLHSIDKYPGNGIGLAKCKKIIEMHGGEIAVESVQGEGSIFTFTISKL